MRKWLLYYIRQLFIYVMGSTEPTNPDEIEGSGEEVQEELEKICPICGEPWEEGEIFCYHCGYELRDEEVPLNPPPERTGAITDPDGLVDEGKLEEMGKKVELIAEGRKIDIAFLILPEGLGKAVHPQDVTEDGRAKEYSLEGIGFGLYNTWMVGKDTELKGMLVVINPRGNDRVLVQGRNGPGIEGSEFREIYASFSYPEGSTDIRQRLGFELEYLAEKIGNL